MRDDDFFWRDSRFRRRMCHFDCRNKRDWPALVSLEEAGQIGAEEANGSGDVV